MYRYYPNNRAYLGNDEFDYEISLYGIVMTRRLAKPLESTDDYSRAVWGPDCKLPYMNYTDSFWKQDRTIYGRKQEGLHYDYNDRLQSYDSKMFKVGQKCAEKHEFSANWWKAHLEAYLLREVTVAHIIGGCNRATGYEYYAIGYKPGLPLPVERVNKIRHTAGRLRYAGRMGTRLPTTLQAFPARKP